MTSVSTVVWEIFEVEIICLYCPMMNLASIWSLVDSNSVSTHNCLSTWEVRCRSHCWSGDTEECLEASYWTVSEGVYVFRGIQHSWSAYSNADTTRLLTIILNSVLEELVVLYCFRVFIHCVILFTSIQISNSTSASALLNGQKQN